MESSHGEMDGNTEELTGRKKSRFKFLKTRLFGRLRKKETEGQMKQSKSTSDVTAQGGKRGEEESEDDCRYPQGTLSSRALSHDSIFLADQPPSNTEPARVLSQENVHSKIKALQVKLQQQNMRLGPPPLLIPGKRIEDSGTTSEDDGLPCSPPEMSFQEHPEAKKHLSLLSLSGTGSEEEDQGGSSQPPSRPLSPVSRLSTQAGISTPTDLLSPTAGADFSGPAHHVTCLDNSAARHRMSVKPRNQRASTKGKKQPDVYRPRSKSMNNLDQPLSEKEEAPEIITSAECVHHQSYSSQVINPEQEPSSPVPVSAPSIGTLQDQQEITQLDVGPLSRDNKVPKSGETFQPDHLGEDLRKEPANIQHTQETAVDTNEGHQPTASLEPQATCPVLNIVTACTVTEEKTGESVAIHTIDQTEMLKKNVGPSDRSHPVPAPRTKRSIVDSKNSMSLKTSNPAATEVEKETDHPETPPKDPSEGLDGSSREGDKSQRPSSFRFSIASAKYRSKTISIENVPKQDEESPADALALRGPSYCQNVELPVEKVEDAKTNEVYKSVLVTQDKRSSLRRDVIPQNVSKTVVGSKAEKCEGLSQTTVLEKSEKAEESKEKRGLFGVKLRTTSLSLKYRSDVAKSEDKAKRHSLEAHHLLAVTEDHTGKEPFPKDAEEVSKEKKANVANLTPQNSDLQQDPAVDRGSDRDTSSVSEPAWMSLAREKTRAHQPSSSKPSTQPDQPPQNSTPLSTAFPSSVQQPPKPTPQPRPPLRTTTKSQLRTCFSTELQPDNLSSQQTPPKPAPRALMEKRALSNQGGEKGNGSQTTNGAELVDAKGPPKPAVKSNMQTDPDVLRRTPAVVPTAKPEPASSSAAAAASSLSHQQSSSDRGQPSWMELAKRKSLAWSDKSLD
ncbi:uncharacterized protein cracdlb [Salminus brasiliensis]|uniref:uncharacterized protein cracdlb n=1 Tax=Salminus brasiliensis TaxID=930266 RepID=UPI003B83081C